MTSSGSIAPYVAVVGPGEGADQADIHNARLVGRLLADRGAVVVCGGLDGVMAAACEGASSRGGLTVGLLPGRHRHAANRHVTVALATGLGELRNGLIVSACDAVIAIGGSWGTLSEIALAMRSGKPTIVIGGWTINDPAHDRASGLFVAESPIQAVDEALRRAAAGDAAGGTQ